MALLLFSSFQMKINDAIVEIPVPWIVENAHLLSIDGAIYPDELNGLPLISKALDQANISDFVVSNIRRTEVSQTISEKLDITFPVNATLVSLKKLKERGNERVFLDIFPIQFDSISGKYFQVNYLEVEFKTSTNRQQASNLRTGENAGNSVLTTGDWYKIPITGTGVYKIDYDFLNNSGINVTGINPKKIKIHGNGEGMLPQQNSEERPVDLVENAIQVVGIRWKV